MIAPLPLRSFANEFRDFIAEARQRVAQVNLTFEQAQQLTDEHGSPCLVVLKSKWIDTHWAMKHSMPGVDLYYAAKANPDHHILSALCAEKAYVDVCSAGEMAAYNQLPIHGSGTATGQPIKGRGYRWADWTTFYGMAFNILTTKQRSVFERQLSSQRCGRHVQSSQRRRSCADR